VSTVSFGFKYPFDPVKASNEDVARGYKNVRAGGCIFLSFFLSFFLFVSHRALHSKVKWVTGYWRNEMARRFGMGSKWKEWCEQQVTRIKSGEQ